DSGRADEGDVIGAAFGQPDLAGAPEDLAHVCAIAREAVALEGLHLRIEAQHRVAAEVAYPHLVARVHVHRIGARTIAGELEASPASARGVVVRELSAEPFADPELAAAVAPDAPRALPGCGRLHDGGLAGAAVDARDEGARERAPPHLAARRGADAIGTDAARRLLDGDGAGLHRHASHHPALPGKPEVAVVVEARGIEVGR